MRFLIKRNSRRNVTGATLACVVLALHAVVPLGTTHAEGAAEQDVPLVQTSYSGSPDARGNREGVARPNQLLLGKGLHPPSVACSWSVQARARTHLQKKTRIIREEHHTRACAIDGARLCAIFFGQVREAAMRERG